MRKYPVCRCFTGHLGVQPNFRHMTHSNLKFVVLCSSISQRYPMNSHDIPIFVAKTIHFMSHSLKHVRSLTSFFSKLGHRTGAKSKWRNLEFHPEKVWLCPSNFFRISCNVGKTIPCLPSPSHHNFYRWYVTTIPSHGWFMIVLPTLYIYRFYIVYYLKWSIGLIEIVRHNMFEREKLYQPRAMNLRVWDYCPNMVPWLLIGWHTIHQSQVPQNNNIAGMGAIDDVQNPLFLCRLQCPGADLFQ